MSVPPLGFFTMAQVTGAGRARDGEDLVAPGRSVFRAGDTVKAERQDRLAVGGTGCASLVGRPERQVVAGHDAVQIEIRAAVAGLPQLVRVDQLPSTARISPSPSASPAIMPQTPGSSCTAALLPPQYLSAPVVKS